MTVNLKVSAGHLKFCHKTRWTRRDLNPWPSRCKRDDLPLIYEPWYTQRLALYNFSFLVLYLFLIEQQANEKQGFIRLSGRIFT